MKRLVALLLFPVAALAWQTGGEPSFFAWTPPTQRVDGSLFDPATEAADYTLRCAKNGATNYLVKAVGYGIDNKWTVPKGTFSPGNWVCSIYVTDKGALQSDDSEAVEFLVANYAFQVKPAAPTGLSVG